MNTYAYVGGNPLSLTDPFGLASTTMDDYRRQRPLWIIDFIPGLHDVIHNIIKYCKDDDSACEREWEQARRRCRQLIWEETQQQYGKKRKRSVKGVTGGYKDVESCAKGLVSQKCGGNRVDEGKPKKPKVYL